MAKKKSTHHEAHTANTKRGTGTFYGQGKKNPVGKNISSTLGNPATQKQIKKPPKSLA